MKKTVLFTGGLGNQLFQFAFVLYLKTIFCDDEICFNKSSYIKHSQHSGFEANKFFDFSGVSEDTKDYYTFSYRLIRKLNRKLRAKNREIYFANDRNFSESKKFKVYESFWQNVKYYETVKDELKIRFVGVDSLCANTELAQLIKQNESVYIHIRRGDYCNNPAYFDLSKTSYYEKAIRLIREKITNPRFFVFSDDIEWCKTYFQDQEDFVYVKYENQSALSDLALMLMCKNSIIANSSFSWWGSALDTKDIVICPNVYFTFREAENLHPDSWIAIDCVQD